MSLSLQESRAARELAEALYDFLPGSGHKSWKGHVSFKTVAERVGIGDYWQPGSKTPMITALLERTLEFRRDRFEPFILEVVRAGLTYRQKQGTPICPEEIEKINGLIFEIGFKFPDLWDPRFIASLRAGSTERASELVSQERSVERISHEAVTSTQAELNDLRNLFLALCAETDRQSAGLKLEKLLNRLFSLCGLSPRSAFRVTGEQIDGSFELDYEVYLLEAKWHKDPLSADALYIFREKVEGKSKFTHGVFVAINGVTPSAVQALTHGKQVNFFIVDGYDLMMVLEGAIELPELLRKRRRLLADDSAIYVPFAELDKV